MDTESSLLEEHLKSITDGKGLWSSWDKAREDLIQPLSTIGSEFRNFSRHDESHFQEIIRIIGRLLGEEGVNALSATDTFLLLMGAYTHDIGMCLSFNAIAKEFLTEAVQKKIKTLETHRDKQVAEAAQIWMGNYDKDKYLGKESLWPLEVKNAGHILIAQIMREEHAERSAAYLNENETIKRSLHLDDHPGLIDCLADIARMHCADFKEVYMNLTDCENGVMGETDNYHPKFLACMIRLGDLLDITQNRFNVYSLNQLKNIPETSAAHKGKHECLKGRPSISQDGIRATFDCKDDAVYREVTSWYNTLEQELKDQRFVWEKIVPAELKGKYTPPQTEKGEQGVQIKYKGKELEHPELMGLQFNISSQRTFEMLKGGHIYKKPGRVFLREIVQNALDATKLQIWEDIDIHLPFTLQKPDREIDSREKILFSDDIPASIYDKYPINLNVDYDKDRQAIIVTCEDWGTGISEESLIRMTSQVGASRKADEKYNETIAEMPYFLQPTAAFGLGLQTVFYVTDEFTVDTHYPGEPTRHIVFRTSTNGSYCSIEEEGFSFQRPVVGSNRKREVAHGTTVTLVVDKEHLRKLFELDEKGVEEFFRAPESIGYLIPEKIDDFARDNFQTIEDVPFHYHSPYLDFENDRAKEEYEFLEESGVFRLYEKRNDNYYKTYSYLIEERKFGSRIQMDFDNSSGPGGNSFAKVSLRGIPTDRIDGWWGPHLDITWDLCCREADKVANLSRDGLLPEGGNWCRKTIIELLPSCIQLIHEHLKASWREAKERSLLDQYAHLCLLNWLLPQPLKVDLTPLKKHYLLANYKDYCVVDNKGNSVDTQRLIESQEIVVVETHGLSEFNNIIKKNSKDLKEDEIFIHDAVTIPDTYIYTEMFALRDDANHNPTCYRLRKTDSTSVPQLVSIPNKEFVRQEMGLFSINGVALHGFQEYKEIVVSQEAPLLGYRQPPHGNCWIYPLRDRYKVWMKMLIFQNEADKYLREKDRIKSQVPEHIVKLILKYSEELKKSKESEEEKVEIIYDTYIRLILDHWFGDKDER